MAIGNIMRHQKLLFGINIAETAVRDAVASSNLMVELSARSDLIAVVVSA